MDMLIGLLFGLALPRHSVETAHEDIDMPMTTVTSSDFARDLTEAKRAASAGPVIVTDGGRPAYALLKIDDYYRLAKDAQKSLLAIMEAIPGGDIDFDPPTLTENDLKPADF